MQRSDEHQPLGTETPQRFSDLGTHRLPVATFDQLCRGAVTEAAMALLESSQYSQRKLALRALIEQLEDNPDSVGALVSPDHAWEILAQAERHDPDVVKDILLYPTVGVWLMRALHHTRPGRSGETSWPEVGYLHLIAAAAAIRCRIRCVIGVPVWHGVVTLPTVGQWRLPIHFPVGMAEVRCEEHGTLVRVCGAQASIDLQSEALGPAFSQAKRHVSTSRGLTLMARIDDLDPYREFDAPQPPDELDHADLSEWHKMLDEAWEVLTLWHREYARELSAGLRALIPVRPEFGIVGASSPAAFGGIIVSASGSAIDLAETLVHELQHSKLNALLGLVELAHDDGEHRYYAPWRDDPRPLTALLHGIYAFTCGAEFMLVQQDLAREPDARHIEFAFALRRDQLRRTVNLVRRTSRLTQPGRHLVNTIAGRLTACEHTPVPADLRNLVDLIATDHYALWRLCFLRPDPAMVESVSTAWLDGAPAASIPADTNPVVIEESRALPARRRHLLRTKALEPDLFARLARRPAALTDSAAHADLALCLGDQETSAAGYRNRLRANPNDLEAWVGLGLTLRAQERAAPAKALLEWPELTLAAHSRIRVRSGTVPDPVAFASWIGAVS